MPQRTIGVSEECYQAFQQVLDRFRHMGAHCSASMALDHLANTYLALARGYTAIMEFQGKASSNKEVLEMATDLIRKLLHDKPMKRQRNDYKWSKHAPIEKRLEMVQLIREFLGLDDPPKPLVDHFLDQGSMALTELRKAKAQIGQNPVPSEVPSDELKIDRLT